DPLRRRLLLRRELELVGELEHVSRSGIAVELGGEGEAHAGAGEIVAHGGRVECLDLAALQAGVRRVAGVIVLLRARGQCERDDGDSDGGAADSPGHPAIVSGSTAGTISCTMLAASCSSFRVSSACSAQKPSDSAIVAASSDNFTDLSFRRLS